MTATVFTHFFDEELLLPHWLRHHREMFDHGVLVDRGSTDRSVEIVRELVPDWEIVRSRNPLFDARDTDLEMMGLERRYGGWKVVLNVTELLLADGLGDHLAAAEARTLGVPWLQMVDAPGSSGTPLDDRPLFLQRHHHVPAPGAQPLRFIHREPDGAYGPGRHAIGRTYAPDEELVILKYAWSPYPQIRERRLQIARGIPEADLALGMSWGLFFTADELDEQFALLSAAAIDAAADPRAGPLIERLAGGYAPLVPSPVPRVEPAAADVVVTDAAAWCTSPAVRDSWAALAVDLTAADPAEVPERLLLRGDFFLWPAAHADAWRARFIQIGRLAPDLVNLPLLAAELTPDSDRAAALAPFLAEPRRTTSRVAEDTTIAASRIAYRHRHAAALNATLSAANQIVELTNENARLREELARGARPRPAQP